LRILISNDDGFDSPGIQFLAKAMEAIGEVFVVAPHRERSTAGHSLTLHKPLRIREHAPRRFSTSGTPADCIYLGVHYLLKTKPDLIVSGINRGANLGTDVFYSGTVAAAREGALMNIRSYAFSLVNMTGGQMDEKEPFRYEMASQIARAVVENTKDIAFPSHSLINVNIPNVSPEKIKGVEIARQGFRHYKAEVTRGVDPRGKEYFWVGGPYKGFEESGTSDCHAVQEGYVSLTPLTIDCTYESFYGNLLKQFPGGFPSLASVIQQ